MFRGGYGLKRIIVWIDSKDDDVEKVRRKLNQLLNSAELSSTIVCVSDVLLAVDK